MVRNVSLQVPAKPDQQGHLEVAAQVGSIKAVHLNDTPSSKIRELAAQVKCRLRKWSHHTKDIGCSTTNLHSISQGALRNAVGVSIAAEMTTFPPDRMGTTW